MQARGMWSAGQGDDNERFLAELRALRDTSALGFDELAARAHYPSDVLKEAENGPSLPGLPILAAYVRACDGDVPEWEERWRRLGFEAGADPGLPVRPAGASPAAVAGARAGVGVAPPDAYDPDRIKAALRGSHLRADKAAQASAGQQTASPARGGYDGAEAARSSTAHESPGSRGGWGAGSAVAETARWNAGAAAEGTDAGWHAGAAGGVGPNWEAAAAGGADGGWDTAAARNGDAGRDAGGQRKGTASPEAWSGEARPDAEPQWGPGSRWDARPSWDTTADQDSTATSGNHHAWPREDAAGAFPEAPDTTATAEALRRDPFSSSWLDDSQPIPPVPDTDTGRTATDDAELAAQEWRDFWTPVKATAAPADIQQPSAPPTTDEPAKAETSWSAFTPPSSKITAEPVRRAAPDPEPAVAADAPTVELRQAPIPAQPAAAGSAATARAQAPTRPAVPEPTSAPPGESRPDRYYPLRLLAVIVVAALIGSVLVMILR